MHSMHDPWPLLHNYARKPYPPRLQGPYADNTIGRAGDPGDGLRRAAVGKPVAEDDAAGGEAGHAVREARQARPGGARPRLRGRRAVHQGPHEQAGA